jgi:hypothetical protein
VTKQQALDQLVGLDGTTPTEATALKIRVAVEHSAALDEVAECLGISVETLERSYPGAIAEAGRVGHFRGSGHDLAASEAPTPLYVPDTPAGSASS